MRLKPSLTLEDAKMMVEACGRAARALGREGTIAIVDAGGHLIYLERPDLQSPNSVDVAAMKARTAAFRERPSSNLEERVKERPGWLMFPNGLPMSGGVPLFHGKECVSPPRQRRQASERTLGRRGDSSKIIGGFLD
jgi:glc operon protein GlcG